MYMREGLVILVAVVFLVAFASVSIADAALEEAYCFDYYEFQEGVIFENFQTEKTSYSPGQTAKIVYDLTSNMSAPIVEGFERVQVFYNHPQKGEQMLDEFFTSEEKDIYLMQGDSVRREIEWKIPEGAKEGEYVVKIYLATGDMYNLAGLSMVPYGPPGVPGEQTTFQVTDGGDSMLYFDKNSTQFNGEKYKFGDFVPIINSSESVSISTDLVNVGPAKEAELEVNIYPWDDLTQEPLEQYSVSRTVSLTANGKERIKFSTPPLSANAYEVKLEAVSGEEKALMKLRFGVSGSRGRFIYSGLTDFPLEAGSETKAFICMSNAADHVNSFTGKGSVQFVDESGEVVYSSEFGEMSITPSPMGLAESFTPDRTVSRGKLITKMYDENDNLVDSVSLVYDYSKFPNIPAELSLDVNKNQMSEGEMAEYTVSYSAEGIPLQGDLLVYLLNPEGNVIYTRERPIDGQYTGKIKPVGGEGDYTLKVREKTHDLEDEKVLSVTARAAGGQMLWLFAGILIVVIALLAIYFSKK